MLVRLEREESDEVRGARQLQQKIKKRVIMSPRKCRIDLT